MTYLPQLVNWLINSSSSSSSSSSDYYDDGDEPDQSINDDVVSCDQLADIDSVACADPPSSSTLSSKRRRSDENDESAKRSVSQKRVWTKEDELELLHGFLDYTNRKRIVLINGRRNQKDHITSFYNDHVSAELKLRFNKSQTVEKLRRLKRKYVNFLTKKDDLVTEFRFKSAHDRATFGISHEIWRRTRSTSADTARRFGEDASVVDDNVTPKITRSQARAGLKRSSAAVDNIIKADNIFGQEDMRELVMGLGLNYPFMLIKFCDDKDEVLNIDGEYCDDEKWKEEQMLELEVYLKRLELVQAKVKAALDKLRSKVDK